ncbi:type I polyketide synthase [Streptoalloteichus hindustanus]|nr:type I polyketide synthase [Streptoalloteichus hindustanus]
MCGVLRAPGARAVRGNGREAVGGAPVVVRRSAESGEKRWEDSVDSARGGTRGNSSPEWHSSEAPPRLGDHPIAVVGLSSLFPHARNPREFWHNVVTGRDCTDDVPETHWSVEDYYDPDPATPDRTYCRRGAFLPAVPFHPLDFGLPPRVARATDVLQLLSLAVARDLLRDVGVERGGIDGGGTEGGAGWYDRSRTGVVLGVSGALTLGEPLRARLAAPVVAEAARAAGVDAPVVAEIVERFLGTFVPWTENSFPGSLPNVVAGRIANRFDLGGLNCVVDAACASSLGALRLAVSELTEGRADMMITGGCDVSTTALAYVCFSSTPVLSPSERVRPFDAAADGTLLGEGIGMLALRRLADARRDGNRIYAVIRGLGAASDGRSSGVYAPRAEGQAAALRRAYADAGVAPSSVGLFEAHGTGTVVGDATELSTVVTVVNESTSDRRFAALGSVKSQIGHTKAAAGAAGLIKAALALHQKVLPPTINVDRPNPAVPLADTGLYLNTVSRPWIRDPARPRRRAAVTSFGFGGANYHCVLEEHEGEAEVVGPAARVALWSAPDVDALLDRLMTDLPAEPNEISPSHPRIGVVYRDERERNRLREQAIARLHEAPDVPVWTHPAGIAYRAEAMPTDARVAALFSGQGSQYLNMGRSAAMAVPPVRAAFDAMNAVFVDAEPMSRVVFPPPAFGDEEVLARQREALRRTEYAQPAIGALSAGQFRWLSELGFTPAGCLGHSFGELTALWAAGALDDAAFCALARARGVVLAPPRDAPPDFDPGSMVALAADESTVRNLISPFPYLVICNVNAPREIVVGGATRQVEQLVETCAARGIRARPLPVSAAFHTTFVAHAVDAFAVAVRSREMTAPRIPVFANTPGASYGHDIAANRRVLAEQLRHPVAFADQLRAMYDQGFRIFVEFGPNAVLTGFARRTLTEPDVLCVPTDGGPSGDSDLALKKAALTLVVAGLPLRDINRHVAAPWENPPGRGAAIMLNGANPPPESKRPQPVPDVGQPDVVPSPPTEEPTVAAQRDSVVAREERVPAVAAEPGAPVPVSQLGPGMYAELSHFVTRQLALHGEFLSGQLRVARQAVAVLADHANSDRLAEVRAALDSVRAYGETLADAHVRASRTLLDFLRSYDPRAMAPQCADDAVVPVQRPTPPPEITHETSVLSAVLSSPPEDAPEVPPQGGDAQCAPGGGVPDQADRSGPDRRSGAGVPPTASQVRAALLEIVAERTGYDLDMLEPGMDIATDLGIDSISRVEILAALRDRFPTVGPLDERRLSESRTLADVEALLVRAAGHGKPTITEILAPDPESARPEGNGTSEETKVFRETVVAPRVRRRGLVSRDLPEAQVDVHAYVPGAVALVVDDGSTTAELVVSDLCALGMRVYVLVLPDAPRAEPADGTCRLDDWDEAELARVVAEVVATTGRLDLCVQVAAAAASSSGSVADSVRRLTHALLVAKHTQRHLEASLAEGRSGFLVVTRAAAASGTAEVDVPRSLLGAVSGLVRTLAVEAPGLFCRAVEIDADSDDLTVRQLVRAELMDADTTVRAVVHEGHRRSTVDITDLVEPVGAESDGAESDGWDPTGVEPHGAAEDATGTCLGPDDLLVVTGGARGVTAHCVTALARAFPCRLLILGRTPVAEEPGWAVGLAGQELRAAITAHLREHGGVPTPVDVERWHRALCASREVRETLAGCGPGVEYLAVDVLDSARLHEVLAPYADRVTGVVHGAGVLADCLVVDKKAEDVHRVLATKLVGLDNVLSVLDVERLRHVVVFSSVVALLGNRGQADYAMANDGLNRYAAALRACLPAARVTSVNWGPWAGGMVTPRLGEALSARGVALLPADSGAAMFVRQFGPRRAGDGIVVIGADAPDAWPDGRPPDERGTTALTPAGEK